jgi:DNA-binding MarR family transcriptional regulator
MGCNLDPLERRDFVAMITSATDGRERVAHLSPAGEAAILVAMPHWRAAQKQVAGLVPHDALDNLTNKLRASDGA